MSFLFGTYFALTYYDGVNDDHKLAQNEHMHGRRPVYDSRYTKTKNDLILLHLLVVGSFNYSTTLFAC